MLMILSQAQENFPIFNLMPYFFEIGIGEAEKSYLKKHSDIRFNMLEYMTHRLNPRIEAVKTLLLVRLTMEREI